jgi:hypothetical protein
LGVVCCVSQLDGHTSQRAVLMIGERLLSAHNCRVILDHG